MKGLLKLAFFTGLGTVLWKGWQGSKEKQSPDHSEATGSTSFIRDAGPAEQQGIEAEDWDVIDEQSDESFPASDPPGNYRGVA